VQQLEFHGDYSQHTWGNFEQPAHGLPADANEWASVIGTMVSEPASPLLGVGSGGQAAVIFLFWLLTLTRGPATIFFRMKRASLKY
jgi:hypothetical protein